MARRRFQTGCLLKRGKRSKVWVARWRETVIQPGGSFRRVQRSEVLGTVAGIPTKRQALDTLARRLREVNQRTPRARAVHVP